MFRMSHSAPPAAPRRYRSQSRWIAAASMAMLAALVGGSLAFSDDAFDEEPIRYAATPARDPIARLQARLDSGEVTLSREPGHGYLKSVLGQLGIPASSQMLVFSKTS